MTLPNTGPLSYQAVINEFDIQFTFNPPVALSGDFKKMTEDETDPTAMSELRGQSAAYVADIVVSSTTSGVYNLRQAVLNDGWNGNSAVIVNFTVESGATIYGSGGSGTNNTNNQDGSNGTNGSLAIRTGNFNGWLVEAINMTVNGQISGGGGGGGGGGATDDWSGGNITSQSGGNGGNGGTGILIDGNDEIAISGTGAIYGGGGGGGGGMGAAGQCWYSCTTTNPDTGDPIETTCPENWLLGGGGGGGGESIGGHGDGGTNLGGDGGTSIHGNSGGNGSVNSAGDGGSGAVGSGSSSQELHAGDGGNGGDNGNDGQNGQQSQGSSDNYGQEDTCWEQNRDTSGRSGGTRGYYINGISQTTFTGDWSGNTNGRVT